MRKKVERCGHTHRDQHSGSEKNVELKKVLGVAVNMYSGFPLENVRNIYFMGQTLAF